MNLQNRTMSTVVFALALGCVAGSLGAEVPEYEFELQARSSTSNPYNLPESTFFVSATPTLNDHGQIAITVGPVDGDSDFDGIWFKDGDEWVIGFTSEAGAFLSDVDMNNDGFAVTRQTFSSLNGVYFYDHASDSSGFLTNDPIGNSDWASVQVNDEHIVGFRGNFTAAGRFYYSIDVDEEGFFHAVVSGIDPDSPYAWLFTPSLNNNHQIAGKALLDAGGNEIRIFESDGSSVLIAVDSGVDPSSPFSGFDNSVHLADTGAVAFIASLEAGGRGVYRADPDNDTLIEIATTNHHLISDIEFFHPRTNDDGLVVFRAFDDEGKRAIFVGDGNNLERVIRDGDEIESDLGPAKIGRPDGSPVFGGNPDINANGDIAFQCSLVDAKDPDTMIGSGIFIGLADESIVGDLTGDGTVGVEDMLILIGAWGDCETCDDCPADLNGDCTVGVSDLLILLENWG